VFSKLEKIMAIIGAISKKMIEIHSNLI
jgi:hypothetical protein